MCFFTYLYPLDAVPLLKVSSLSSDLMPGKRVGKSQGNILQVGQPNFKSRSGAKQN